MLSYGHSHSLYCCLVCSLKYTPLPGATSICPQLPIVLSACSSRRLPRLSLPLFRSPSCPVCSLCLCVLRSRRYCLLLLVFLPALFAFPSPASCVTWISAHQRSFFRLLAPCPSARPLSPPRSLLSFSFLDFHIVQGASLDSGFPFVYLQPIVRFPFAYLQPIVRFPLVYLSDHKECASMAFGFVDRNHVPFSSSPMLA